MARDEVSVTTGRAVDSCQVSLGNFSSRLSDSAMRYGLLREGVGWSRLPREQIEADLRRGDLVELSLDHDAGIRTTDLSVMVNKQVQIGPATRWIFEHLAEVGRG